jgi:putative FmdB family regulatory protein
MPIYEFECRECGAEFEKIVRKAGAVSEVVCPVCNGRKIDEKVSAFSSMVKGGSTSKSGNCAPSGG